MTVMAHSSVRPSKKKIGCAMHVLQMVLLYDNGHDNEDGDDMYDYDCTEAKAHLLNS